MIEPLRAEQFLRRVKNLISPLFRIFYYTHDFSLFLASTDHLSVEISVTAAESFVKPVSLLFCLFFYCFFAFSSVSRNALHLLRNQNPRLYLLDFPGCKIRKQHKQNCYLKRRNKHLYQRQMR